MQIVFDRKITARTPGVFQTKVIAKGVAPVIQAHYKHSKLKQYFKAGRALRTETTVNDPYDFGVGRLLTREICQQLAELLGPLARAAGLKPTMHEFNLGESVHDFRVPDGGLHRPGAAGVWHLTAAAVIEILSPDDETWQKLPFFAQHDVDEVLIVDPVEHRVSWLALRDGKAMYG